MISYCQFAPVVYKLEVMAFEIAKNGAQQLNG